MRVIVHTAGGRAAIVRGQIANFSYYYFVACSLLLGGNQRDTSRKSGD